MLGKMLNPNRMSIGEILTPRTRVLTSTPRTRILTSTNTSTSSTSTSRKSSGTNITNTTSNDNKRSSTDTILSVGKNKRQKGDVEVGENADNEAEDVSSGKKDEEDDLDEAELSLFDFGGNSSLKDVDVDDSSVVSSGKEDVPEDVDLLNSTSPKDVDNDAQDVANDAEDVDVSKGKGNEDH